MPFFWEMGPSKLLIYWCAETPCPCHPRWGRSLLHYMQKPMSWSSSLGKVLATLHADRPFHVGVGESWSLVYQIFNWTRYLNIAMQAWFWYFLNNFLKNKIQSKFLRNWGCVSLTMKAYCDQRHTIFYLLNHKEI